MDLDSLAPTVCGFEFREPTLAEVEVCLDGGTGIDEARLGADARLVLPAVDVEGIFLCC